MIASKEALVAELAELNNYVTLYKKSNKNWNKVEEKPVEKEPLFTGAQIRDAV